MTWKEIWVLLTPCILFVWMAGYAVFYAMDFTNMAQGKEMVERHRKDTEIKQIVAGKIALGDPWPTRKLMLEEIDDRDKKMNAMEGIVVDCAGCMRHMGFGVLLGVAAQFYVVFRLRAHHRKLQREGSVATGV